jgi:hypothetical protein
LFQAENWKGTEQIPGFVPGIYHEACFSNSSYRNAYFAIDRRVRNAELDNPGEYLVVVGRTPELALTLRPVTGMYSLYLLGRGWQINFRQPTDWRQFVAHISSPDGLLPTPAGDPGGIRIARNREGWDLAMRQEIPGSVELKSSDSERIRQHLTGRGIDPSRTPVDLGALCRQLSIVPVTVGCPLERVIGKFTWPDVSSHSQVTLRVWIEKWYRTRLTSAEMTGLRQFLLSLNRAEAN